MAKRTVKEHKVMSDAQVTNFDGSTETVGEWVTAHMAVQELKPIYEQLGVKHPDQTFVRARGSAEAFTSRPGSVEQRVIPGWGTKGYYVRRDALEAYKADLLNPDAGGKPRGRNVVAGVAYNLMRGEGETATAIGSIKLAQGEIDTFSEAFRALGISLAQKERKPRQSKNADTSHPDAPIGTDAAPATFDDLFAEQPDDAVTA